MNVSHLRRAVRPRETLTKLDTATDGSPGDQQIDVDDLVSDTMNDTPEITEFTIKLMFPSPDIAGVETIRASMVRRGALVHCFDLPDIPFPLSEPRGPGQPSPRPLAYRTG